MLGLEYNFENYLFKLIGGFCADNFSSFFVTAFMSLVVTLIGFAALVYFKYPITILYEKFLAFVTTTLVISALLSVALYIKARRTAIGRASDTGELKSSLNTFYLNQFKKFMYKDIL